MNYSDQLETGFRTALDSSNCFEFCSTLFLFVLRDAHASGCGKEAVGIDLSSRREGDQHHRDTCPTLFN